MRDGADRGCDAPGCPAFGEYRAPRSRHELRSYYWFCLAHVREYNARWNYYAGMSEEDVERHIRADTTWWRPTWPLGARSARFAQATGGGPFVDFAAFGADGWSEERIRCEAGAAGRRPRPGSEQERALALFDLEPPVTREVIKARYKVLVKRHHPDANGGDKAAEERLKLINQAYTALMSGIRW